MCVLSCGGEGRFYPLLEHPSAGFPRRLPMQHHGEADGGGALACKCSEGQGSWLAVDVHGENLPNRKGCLTNIPVPHKAL